MMASDEPIVATPTTAAGSGALNRSPSMCTQASSISDAAGYSSWSMWFFRSVSWISSLYCIFSLFVKAGNAVN